MRARSSDNQLSLEHSSEQLKSIKEVSNHTLDLTKFFLHKLTSRRAAIRSYAAIPRTTSVHTQDSLYEEFAAANRRPSTSFTCNDSAITVWIQQEPSGITPAATDDEGHCNSHWNTSQTERPTNTNDEPYFTYSMDARSTTNGGNGAYADDATLNKLRVNQTNTSQPGLSSAPMETDKLPQRPTGLDESVRQYMEMDTAPQGDTPAYANDVGLDNFRIDTSQPSQPSAPMEMDSLLRTQITSNQSGENIRTGAAKHRDQQTVSEQSMTTPTNVSNSPEPPSGSSSVPPPWVVQMG